MPYHSRRKNLADMELRDIVNLTIPEIIEAGAGIFDSELDRPTTRAPDPPGMIRMVQEPGGAWTYPE